MASIEGIGKIIDITKNKCVGNIKYIYINIGDTKITSDKKVISCNKNEIFNIESIELKNEERDFDTDDVFKIILDEGASINQDKLLVESLEIERFFLYKSNYFSDGTRIVLQSNANIKLGNLMK